MGADIPVIGLAGFAKSGKTTFMEKLVAEFKKRGYRVGVIKHSQHRVTLDKPGADTWRHTQAGADTVALAAPGGISMFKSCPGDPAPEQVIAMFSDVDMILIEGYKKGRWPKIEVYHANTAEKPGLPPTELLAVVSDKPQEPSPVPHFSFDDVGKAADLIEMTIVKN